MLNIVSKNILIENQSRENSVRKKLRTYLRKKKKTKIAKEMEEIYMCLQLLWIKTNV